MSRIENWDNGYKPDAIKTKLDAKRPSMETVLTTIYMDQEAVEGLVRGTLAGVSGATAPTQIQSPFYQAAAKQMTRRPNTGPAAELPTRQWPKSS